MDIFVIRNSNLIFANILPGRPLRPYFWIKLALMAKTAHFQGQTSPEAGKPTILSIFVCYSPWIFWWSGIPTSLLPKFYLNVSQDHTYGASWPSRPKRPIFKVKLSSEQVNPQFCRFSCAIVHKFFGDPELRHHFCDNFSWTSVKTLPMELVGPHGQNGPFSWSNDTQSR